MSIIVSIWISSLALLFVLIGIAIYRVSVKRLSPAYAPEGLTDFFSTELYLVVRRISQNAKMLAPHVREVMATLRHVGVRGRDQFAERIFGRIEVEKGRTASFFLKHIAEYKATARKEGGKSAGY